jgi:hypothetical protein
MRKIKMSSHFAADLEFSVDYVVLYPRRQNSSDEQFEGTMREVKREGWASLKMLFTTSW